MFANWTNNKPYTAQDKPLAFGAARKRIASQETSGIYDADQIAWEGMPQTSGAKAVAAYRVKQRFGCYAGLPERGL